MLRGLKRANSTKWPDLWEKHSWILHHDNAPPHRAIIVNELTKHSTNTIEQPPYSPNMAPADFFLFPKLKLLLHGTRFQSVKNIKGEFAARTELDSGNSV
jgi:[histone H3]-lysine36 N-dimethyltransferase SETMAR